MRPCREGGPSAPPRRRHERLDGEILPHVTLDAGVVPIGMGRDRRALGAGRVAPPAEPPPGPAPGGAPVTGRGASPRPPAATTPVFQRSCLIVVPSLSRLRHAHRALLE